LNIKVFNYIIAAKDRELIVMLIIGCTLGRLDLDVQEPLTPLIPLFYYVTAYFFTYRWRVCRDIPSILQISATDVPVSAYSLLASLIFSGESAFGLPPNFPRDLAASSPAFVRSRMMSRSNSASAPKM
jgi:hypothetical protein